MATVYKEKVDPHVMKKNKSKCAKAKITFNNKGDPGNFFSV